MKIVDVAENTPTDSWFVDLLDLAGEPVRWSRFSALPRNALERRLTRPRLSRYRAAWEASGAASDAAAIISHLPLMTAATGHALRIRARRVPHLGFSFNFTTLPRGSRLANIRRGVSSVDRFTVYTAFEAALYSDTFKIPLERFSRLDWTQPAPLVGDIAPGLLPPAPFVAAVGGEARDYPLVLAMARAMPQLAFVLIARPSPLFDDLPANVLLFTDIPGPMCWGIASRAAFTLVPLRNAETCCGHLTLVSARLAGIPLITSRSEGTREYSEGYRATLIAEPGALDQWVDLLERAMPKADEYRALAELDRVEALARHDRRHWQHFVEDFLHTHTGERQRT